MSVIVSLVLISSQLEASKTHVMSQSVLIDVLPLLSLV